VADGVDDSDKSWPCCNGFVDLSYKEQNALDLHNYNCNN